MLDKLKSKKHFSREFLYKFTVISIKVPLGKINMQHLSITQFLTNRISA